MTGAAWRRRAALAVHVLTLSGAVAALGAIAAAADGDLPLAFALLGLAMLIDGIDGPLARWLDIAVLLQRWRGEVLDQIVDYVAYVLVPAYIVYAAGLMPYGLNFAVAALICVSAGFNFADRRAKAEDNFFVGFPAAWNLVAFHLVAFALPPWIALALVVLCAGATFLPVPFAHPLRVRRLRPVTVAMTLVWAVAAAWTLADGMRPGIAAGLGLLVPLAYFLALSALRASRFWRA